MIYHSVCQKLVENIAIMHTLQHGALVWDGERFFEMAYDKSLQAIIEDYVEEYVCGECGKPFTEAEAATIDAVRLADDLAFYCDNCEQEISRAEYAKGQGLCVSCTRAIN